MFISLCYLVEIIKKLHKKLEIWLKGVLIQYLIFQQDQSLNENQLKEYVSRCKDMGVKQALVIGGSREPVGNFDSSIQTFRDRIF